MPNAEQNTPSHASVAYEPVAGCRAVSGASAALAARYDRRWLAMDDVGAWINPQHAPRLADIEVALRYGYLVLRAPGMLRVDVPLEVLEDDDSVVRTAIVGTASIPVVDEGDVLATWLSNVLQRPCRLVKRHPPDVALVWPDRAPG